MPRGGHGSHGSHGHSSHTHSHIHSAIHSYHGTGYHGPGRTMFSSSYSHAHYYHRRSGGGGGGHYRPPPPMLLTPAQAAHAEASALYSDYYAPRGCCRTLPYYGALLTLVSLVLTLASLLTPVYFFGGAEPLPNSRSFDGEAWGAAASLTSLTYCQGYSPLGAVYGAPEWFSLNCDDALPWPQQVSRAPFEASLVLCALAIALHLLALLYPALPCLPCADCGDGGSPCRPAHGPRLRAAHAAVLGLKLAPALLGLAGALAALYGLPAAALAAALGSPRPGAQDAPGAALLRAAVALAWGAVALELAYCAAAAAAAAGAERSSSGRPLPPPEAPPPPTALEERALAQGAGALRAGLLHLLQPAPVLPEDLRAYGVLPLGGGSGSSSGSSASSVVSSSVVIPGSGGAGAAGTALQVELYHCRLRLYQGAPLKEDGVGGALAAAPHAAAAPGEETVPLVLVQGMADGVRVRVRLGEEGSALQQAQPGGGGGGGGAVGLAQALPPPVQGQAAGAAPHFCAACGASLAGAAHYCVQCGAGVAAQAASSV